MPAFENQNVGSATAGTGLRRARRSRILKWAALTCVAAALTLIAVLAWQWPFSKARVTRSIQETFPATVTFIKFRSTYFPHPGCIAEGVTFHWLASEPQAAPIATIAKLHIEAHYFDILFRPGYLDHMFLKEFRISVPPVGTPRRKYDWQETPSRIRVGEIVADGAVLTIARQNESSPLVFRIHQATLNSVSPSQPFAYFVSLHNPLPPGEIVSRGKFGPWISGDPGRTPVSGNYAFHQADLSVFRGISGMLSSDDEFAGPLGHIEARGSVDVPDFSVTRSGHAVHLRSKFHAFVNGLNGDVTLDQVTGGFLGTSVAAKGAIAAVPGEHGKTARINFSVTNGRIQDVLYLFVRDQKSPLKGVTSFRAQATLPPGEGRFLQKLRVVGDFGIASGQFTNAETQQSVDDLSERASGAKPSAERSKADNIPPDDDNVISNLSGHVEMSRGVATFNDFSFSVPSAVAHMHGTYNLHTRAVDLHGTLKTDAAFSHLASGFKSALLKPFNVFFKRKRAGAVVPVQLLGTYDDPKPGLELLPGNSSPAPLAPAPTK